MISAILSVFLGLVVYIYEWIQVPISWAFSPLPPPKHGKKFGHVAVIGAGLSGISTASQLVSHGFEVTIFEAGSKSGGIWANVNSTSGLQINSVMYRFHPMVLWRAFYPHRDEILENIRRICDVYSLNDRIRFDTPVTKVERHSSSTKEKNGSGHTRWVINGNMSEVFDGLVVTIGTCGKPNFIKIDGQESFKGKIVHSSQLDDVDFKNKRVLIVGGGASGVEAAETALAKGANKPTILARSDKWIIPRNMVVDALLSLQPFGREMPLSFIPEAFIRWFHYRDLTEKMAPTQGFFTGTPIVNNSFLQHVRNGRADYQRGDTICVKEDGIEWNARKRGQKKGEKGEKQFSKADIIILAAGFKRPSFDFLPDDLFPEDYTRPNMYLQVFPVNDWSVLCTNSTFHNAVGTVGHIHIGIYARILSLFLLEKKVRPHPHHMRLWVDAIRFIKENAPGGQLEFFTYMELCVWFLLFMVFRPSRFHFFFFVLFGYGFWVPAKNGGQEFHYSIFHCTLYSTNTPVRKRAVLETKRLPLVLPTWPSRN
ncbi:N,N-dimethylaniline monooxygenase [Malassezia pachydermatis]